MIVQHHRFQCFAYEKKKKILHKPLSPIEVSVRLGKIFRFLIVMDRPVYIIKLYLYVYIDNNRFHKIGR